MCLNQSFADDYVIDLLSQCEQKLIADEADRGSTWEGCVGAVQCKWYG